MSSRRHLARTRGILAALAAASVLVAVIAPIGADAVPPKTGTSLAASAFAPFSHGGLPDVDKRTQPRTVLRSQEDAASALGATVRWNRLGTPQSVIKFGGDLGPRPSGQSAVSAARGWLATHAALFGMEANWTDGLAVLSDNRLAHGAGHAVVFQQVFGGVSAAVDGLVTVGVSTDAVVYVSSSIARTTVSPAAATLTVTEAWRRAAAEVGRPVEPTAVGDAITEPTTGWTSFAVDGFAHVQQGRLRSLPFPTGEVRPVFEVNVVDAAAGASLAYTSFVDAVTGEILVRQDRTDDVAPSSEYSDTFAGVVTAVTCGPRHTFTVDDLTKTIAVVASEVVTTNDIVLNLYGPSGALVASSDSGTSPEAITYSPGGGIAAGDYDVEVCPFDDPTIPFTEPGNYDGVFVASEQEAGAETPYPPVWDAFLANPALDYDPTHTLDSRATSCWVTQVGGVPVADCDNPPGALNNLAARLPWDVDAATQASTFTTVGNAASTAEAWLSPLTEGGLFQRPVEVDRTYRPAFTDAWNNAQCNPATLVPGGNDILASVTNLFNSHNRMHDFSYFLGFTEANFNLQQNNFGLTDPSKANDPELGNTQAGAITGGFPSYLGRDNANQIALQDGLPGITNQYLFQPIAGAFYAPCVDGDFDMSVVGHEYTHAISNRMVGGPDANLSGLQAGSMGESWSDQVALEYMFEHGYSTGAGAWVEGPYVTANKTTGIRNYALDDNPLQYGDLGYDLTGAEVHADGEVWSAAMYDVRQALVRKFNGSFPESDAALQRACAQGDTSTEPPSPPLPVNQCPGNRRWMQLMFDSFLLQQGGTSMLDARDAFLAADVMRFGGKNQKVLWKAFASNGMGAAASTTSTEDDQPISDYTSPLENEGTMTLEAVTGGSDTPVVGSLYVGDYEARVTPIADTDPDTSLGTTVASVAGKRRFVFQADGFGLTRFSAKFKAGKTFTKTLKLAPNLASASGGAKIDGASVGSINTTKLIDDTEASNWAGINPTGVSVDAVNPLVNVNLAGGARLVRSVAVSAMLRPQDAAAEEDPDNPDPDAGARFTALRRFAIEVCTEGVGSDCSSLLPAGMIGSPYTRIYTSPANAFDSTKPRPLAPDLLFKSFDVPDTMATHVRLVALENQCSGTAAYAGEQDADPLNATDCKSASTADESVRAAELMVFSTDKAAKLR